MGNTIAEILTDIFQSKSLCFYQTYERFYFGSESLSALAYINVELTETSFLLLSVSLPL